MGSYTSRQSKYSSAGPEGAGFDYTLAAAKKVEARLESLRKEGVIERYILGVPRFNGNQFNGGFGNAALAENAGIKSQDLAAQLNLPVIVHNRDADAEVAPIITDWARDAGGRSVQPLQVYLYRYASGTTPAHPPAACQTAQHPVHNVGAAASVRVIAVMHESGCVPADCNCHHGPHLQ